MVIKHKVLDDNVIGKGVAYYYKIDATVKGQIPPDLQEQICKDLLIPFSKEDNLENATATPQTPTLKSNRLTTM